MCVQGDMCLRFILMYTYRGSPHTSQISHLLLNGKIGYSIQELVAKVKDNFLYNLLLMTAVVSNIFEKWLQDFVSFGNPRHTMYEALT